MGKSIQQKRRYHNLRGHKILSMFTGHGLTSTPPTLAECTAVLYQHNWFPKAIQGHTQANLIARRELTRRLLHSGHCYQDNLGHVYTRVAVPNGRGQWGYQRIQRVSTNQQARRLNWKKALEASIFRSRVAEYQTFICPVKNLKDLNSRLDHALADYKKKVA